MSARELVVLGTASQVPTRYRNHNAYFLRWDDSGLLFDPGEGTQRQMLHYGVRTHQLNHVCITHFHGDHCLGLAGLVQRISLDGVPHPVRVHYPASGQVFFERLRRSSIFHDRSHLVPSPIKAAGPLYQEPKFTLSALPLEHGVPSWGFRLEEVSGRRILPERLEELGLRGPAVGQLQRGETLQVNGRPVTLDDVSVAKPGQVFAFVMDTRLCDNAFELARGADMLVCESTYAHEHEAMARDHGHMTSTQAAEVARQAGARRLVLTHFSQRYPSVQPLLEEAAAIHADVVAVKDGDVVAVPKRR